MKTKTLAPAEIVTEHSMGRRSAMRVVAVGGMALIGVSTEACAATGCSDHDIVDTSGHGSHCSSGCTDRDPTDGAGRGRHCSTGCTDHDPTDGVGRGIHCV